MQRGNSKEDKERIKGEDEIELERLPKGDSDSESGGSEDDEKEKRKKQEEKRTLESQLIDNIFDLGYVKANFSQYMLLAKRYRERLESTKVYSFYRLTTDEAMMAENLKRLELIATQYNTELQKDISSLAAGNIDRLIEKASKENIAEYREKSPAELKQDDFIPRSDKEKVEFIKLTRKAHQEAVAALTRNDLAPNQKDSFFSITSPAKKLEATKKRFAEVGQMLDNITKAKSIYDKLYVQNKKQTKTLYFGDKETEFYKTGKEALDSIKAFLKFDSDEEKKEKKELEKVSSLENRKGLKKVSLEGQTDKPFAAHFLTVKEANNYKGKSVGLATIVETKPGNKHEIVASTYCHPGELDRLHELCRIDKEAAWRVGLFEIINFLANPDIKNMPKSKLHINLMLDSLPKEAVKNAMLYCITQGIPFTKISGPSVQISRSDINDARTFLKSRKGDGLIQGAYALADSKYMAEKNEKVVMETPILRRPGNR